MFLRPVKDPTKDFRVAPKPLPLGVFRLLAFLKPCGCASKHFWYLSCEETEIYDLNTSSLLHLQAKLRASHRGGGRDHHLASGFDCLAEGSAAGFAVEHVCDEQILSGVHDEGALLHVATDTEERQVTHSALGDELVVLRGASIVIVIVCIRSHRFCFQFHSHSA